MVQKYFTKITNKMQVSEYEFLDSLKIKSQITESQRSSSITTVSLTI